MSLLRALTFAALLIPRLAAAVPQPTEKDSTAAVDVARLASGSPIDRLVQLLACLELEDPALYLLAGPEPILVDQLYDGKIRLILEYLKSLPATELADLRAGQTVVRNAEGWNDRERDKVVGIAEAYGLKKPKKVKSIRLGVVPGLKIRVEVVGKKGSVEQELAWSTTPDREARARDRLTSRFGARPPEVTSGPGSKLPLEDCSFEKQESLGETWKLETVVEKGTPFPLGEVALEHDLVLDGHSSLRFHSDTQTRSWLAATQSVTIAPGMPIALRGHYKARGIKAERDQEKIFHVRMVFTDAGGNAVSKPISEEISLPDTDWREFYLHGVAPAEASYVRVELACTMSGTAWFDAFTMTIAY